MAATLVGLTLSAVAQDGAAPPARDLSSYALIDDAFEWEYLIAPDAKWQYFLGREEPSPKLEWTARDFSSSSWERGRAPFGFGEGEFGTTVGSPPRGGILDPFEWSHPGHAAGRGLLGQRTLATRKPHCLN